MSSEHQMRAFLADAQPLMYLAELDGTVVFLEGGFRETFRLMQTSAASFHRIQDVLESLSIERNTIDHVLDDLLRCRATEINTKVTIEVNGVQRRHLWIGTLSEDLKYFQGQLIDVEDFELMHDRFDRLRELTYGTKYWGERIAEGKENARVRRVSVMFVDAVDSTSRIFSMEVEKAKEYVENIASIITSVVKQHDGYLDKFMGDGAMIIWGYQILPNVAIGSHAVDSVLAARELMKRFMEFNRGKPELEQIHVRIGLASGDMFSGAFRNDDRMIFTSIGKAIHVAARLEKATDPDSIFVEHAHLLEVQKTKPDIVGHSHCTLLEAKGIPWRIRACKIDWE